MRKAANRESIHTLVALIGYREDNRAFAHARELIQSVDRYFDWQTCTFRYDGFLAETGTDENTVEP